MTENEAREIMERATDSGAPLPNIVEYSEALRKTREVLGDDYTDEQLRNWILCDKYPFLVPRYWNHDTMQYEIHKDYDYKFTELDDMPDGWRKAFGEMMCEEIKQELVRCNYLEEYRIAQIKEKYASLQWYDNGTPVGCKVPEIIEKYSVLSENICIVCGKPDVPTIGTLPSYISPYCKECYTTPSDWYKEKYPDEINEWVEFHTDEWEYFDGEVGNNYMVNSYTVEKWSKDKGKETITYDISETANKIRAKWRSEHGE